MKPSLSWRRVTAEDLTACLAVRPEKNGAELVGNAAALLAWKRLLERPHAARGAAIELHAHGSKKIVGFGFAVFVREYFIHSELNDPQPGLNARIIESVLSGPDPIQTYEEVRTSNTLGCLQQIIKHASWKIDSVTPEQRDEVRVLLGVSYAHIFAGYRIANVLTELVDALDEWHAKGHRSFTVVDRFCRFHATHSGNNWSQDRALALASAESIRLDPGSIAAGLFQHGRIPQFDFTRGEQELLEDAMQGLDDVCLSRHLHVSLPAVKKRWANIFNKVAAVMPELCPADGGVTRGVQKRNRILNYVRQHPEELRPFNMKQANLLTRP